jgi:hypothetical protein
MLGKAGPYGYYMDLLCSTTTIMQLTVDKYLHTYSTSIMGLWAIGDGARKPVNRQGMQGKSMPARTLRKTGNIGTAAG